jgi:hypothetical protein
MTDVFVSPYAQELNITIYPAAVHYFVDPIRGRPPQKDRNYIPIEEPEGIPNYSIANIQDFYLTPKPNSFIVPLFLNIPENIFGEFDSYHTVVAHELLRFDLLSYRFYDTVEYWWIIMLANDIPDPFNVPLGKIVRIPSLSVVLSNWLSTPVTRLRRL